MATGGASLCPAAVASINRPQPVKPPPLPPTEAARIAALDRLAVLDTAPAPEFDELVRLAAQIAEAPIALVSLVDRDRQWFKARCGLDVSEMPRTVSFCGHAIIQSEPLIVSDSLKDDRFHDNPLVTAEPHIRLYAGFPIKSQGHPMGTLCVIDRVPRTLSDRQIRLLAALARQVEVQLELHRASEERSTPTEIPAAVSEAPQAPGEAVEFRIRLRPTVQVEHLGGAFERLTGYRPADFYADPKLGPKLVHPDDRPLLGLALDSPTLFKRPLTLRWRTRDGAWLWLRHELRIIVEDAEPVALRGLAWPLASADAKADRAQVDAGALMEQALDAVAVLEPDGTIRYQSPSFTDVFGYEPSELVGRSAFELVHPDDQSGILSEYAAKIAVPGATARRRYRYRHKDGSWRTVESVGRNMVDDPTIRGVLIQTRDMTAWAQAERALLEARAEAQQLAESRKRLVEDLRRVQGAKEQLTGLIVHDLKSPLTAIIANAHFILEEATAAGVEITAVQDVLQAADTLQRMVLDLLDVGRSEAGQLVPYKSRVDLVALVERVCQGMAAVTRGKKQTLSRTVQVAEGSAKLELDKSLVERVVQNLLDNASRYSPTGTEITVRVSAADEHARIEVLDRGPGVPDAHKGRIFELYARVDRDAIKHARSSQGLGLAFCKLAVEAHGGRIWVEDRPEKGSCFCVELPRRQALQ